MVDSSVAPLDAASHMGFEQHEHVTGGVIPAATQQRAGHRFCLAVQFVDAYVHQKFLIDNWSQQPKWLCVAALCRQYREFLFLRVKGDSISGTPRMDVPL